MKTIIKKCVVTKRGKYVLPHRDLRQFINIIVSTHNDANSMVSVLKSVGISADKSRNILKGNQFIYAKEVKLIEEKYGMTIDECLELIPNS